MDFTVSEVQHEALSLAALITTVLHRDSSQISHCCPSDGDPVALVLLDQSLLALQQVTAGVDVRASQLKALEVSVWYLS